MKSQIIIALTGTPGTGKTAVARELAKIARRRGATSMPSGWLHLELNKLVKKEKLYSGWDKKRKTWIVDENKLEKFVEKFIKENPQKNIVVDSHISHILPAKFFSCVFVMRCEPKVLEARLKRKKWSSKKIRENVEAEIIGLIEWEARRKHKKVSVVDATKIPAAGAASIILKKLKSL